MNSPQIDTFADSEHYKMAAVEDTMFYYIALHSLVEAKLKAVLLKPGSSVLDAGCGTGGLIRRLKTKYKAVHFTGVDLSEVACGLAKQRTDATIVQGSVLELPFNDNTFDGVMTTDVLYHLVDDTKAMREMNRVLKPQGTLVINLPAHPWLWSYHDTAVSGVRRYTRKDVKEKLTQAGFKVSFITHWNSVLLPLIVIRRKWLPPPKEGSDVQTYSPLVERLCRLCLWLERSIISLGVKLPLGSSVLAVATKLP